MNCTTRGVSHSQVSSRHPSEMLMGRMGKDFLGIAWAKRIRCRRAQRAIQYVTAEGSVTTTPRGVLASVRLPHSSRAISYSRSQNKKFFFFDHGHHDDYRNRTRRVFRTSCWSQDGAPLLGAVAGGFGARRSLRSPFAGARSGGRGH